MMLDNYSLILLDTFVKSLYFYMIQVSYIFQHRFYTNEVIRCWTIQSRYREKSLHPEDIDATVIVNHASFFV